MEENKEIIQSSSEPAAESAEPVKESGEPVISSAELLAKSEDSEIRADGGQTQAAEPVKESGEPVISSEEPSAKQEKPENTAKAGNMIYINLPPPEEDDEAFWNEVLSVKPARSRMKFLLWLFLLVGIIIGMLGYTFALNHGKGLFKSLLPVGERISFTLPIADTPALEGKYTMTDGSYSASGLAKAVLPSVVQINSYTKNAMRASSQGSGIIMSEDGYIVTNAHVIAGADFGVTVLLYDKSEYAAKVVGKDDSSDIAVLKISAAKLTPAQFGDSEACELGDEVVAIGSPAGFENSVTKGIVSGLKRQIHAENSAVAMECIQIDAAINPGNSGGPLFNMWGQVVGITSSKLVSTSYDNIGFAITTKSAKPIIERLIENGYVPNRGRIGIIYSSVSEEAAKLRGVVPGLYIHQVDSECDVANTELQPGDIITEIAGIEVYTQKNVNDILDGYQAGDEVTCRVYRPKPDDDGDGVFEEGEYFNITFKLSKDKTSMIEKKG